LAGQLRTSLAALPDVTLRDLGREKCGIVTFTVEGATPRAVQQKLQAQRINVYTAGYHGTPLDMKARGLQSVVRASVHYYNTYQELHQLVAAIGELS
jgi:selenocysteine lyase/cysteine desulfurase